MDKTQNMTEMGELIDLGTVTEETAGTQGGFELLDGVPSETED